MIDLKKKTKERITILKIYINIKILAIIYKTSIQIILKNYIYKIINIK